MTHEDNIHNPPSRFCRQPEWDEYSLPEAVYTPLVVYDVTGWTVTTLLSRQTEAGIHAVIVDARDPASRSYVFRIESGSCVANRRMVLMK